MINPGTLKPYDPRTLKPWNFQTYNNPQKVQTPDNSKTGILEPLNSEKCGFYVKPCCTPISQKEQLQN